MKTAQVTSRYSGGTCIARAGRGKKAKTASATSDQAEAARRAAAKAFGLDSSNIQTAADVVLEKLSSQDQWPHLTTWTATLPDLP